MSWHDLAGNLRAGDRIRWAAREVDVLEVVRCAKRTTGRKAKRWVRLVVDVPGVGRRSLWYEADERVEVVS